MSDRLVEALDAAIALVAGPGNGTWHRQRPIEEWQRLFRLFSDARAALADAASTPEATWPSPNNEAAVKALAVVLHDATCIHDGYGVDCMSRAGGILAALAKRTAPLPNRHDRKRAALAAQRPSGEAE